MPLSWNEIRQRAITFSRDWSDASKENAEAHTFWDEFFHVFGKHRRTVASFEESVKSLQRAAHRIDVFWPGGLGEGFSSYRPFVASRLPHLPESPAQWSARFHQKPSRPICSQRSPSGILTIWVRA